jgi:hypothetical protein
MTALRGNGLRIDDPLAPGSTAAADRTVPEQTGAGERPRTERPSAATNGAVESTGQARRRRPSDRPRGPSSSRSVHPGAGASPTAAWRSWGGRSRVAS